MCLWKAALVSVMSSQKLIPCLCSSSQLYGELYLLSAHCFGLEPCLGLVSLQQNAAVLSEEAFQPSVHENLLRTKQHRATSGIVE